ncbi:hypothetical protein J8J40_24115, partial [Mycobacterium tuberculosis]|nr:hypothetical protein [Mycobacterium tuberculosis]
PATAAGGVGAGESVEGDGKKVVGAERPPITDYDALDRRMRTGELSLAIEIPPGFARDAARGRKVEIAAWIDGAMPTRGETVRGYVQGLHADWLAKKARALHGDAAAAAAFQVAVRYRYN